MLRSGSTLLARLRDDLLTSLRSRRAEMLMLKCSRIAASRPRGYLAIRGYEK